MTTMQRTQSRITSSSGKVNSWKITPPRLPAHHLARRQLTAKINRLLGSRRTATGCDVLLIVAPAGYGKTVLLREWSDQSDRARYERVPVRWYHLDPTDNDPVVLVQGLVEALRVRLPAPYATTWDVLELVRNLRTGCPSPEDLQRLVTVLCTDLQRNLRHPITLILTGISELTRGQSSYSVTDDLLTRPRDNLRLVLECREPPTFHLAPLIAQQRLNGLNWSDLRLTHEEFVAMVAQAPNEFADRADSQLGETSEPGTTSQQTVDVIVTAPPIAATDTSQCTRASGQWTSQELEQLEAFCDGWITGVLLATGTAQPDFLRTYASDEGDRERVRLYLLREVIERFPASVRAFACQAAILETMTVSLCAQLLAIEPSAAKQFLVWLEHRTFVSRVGWHIDSATWRFQPFLREALLLRLQHGATGRDRVDALHRRAAQLLAATGDMEAAIQQYALVGDTQQILAIIEEQRVALMHGSCGTTLMRWIEMLPAPVHAEHPELVILQAELHRQAGRLDAASAAAQQAEQTIQGAEPRRQHAANLTGRCLRVQGHIAFQEGRYDDARHFCERILDFSTKVADEIRIEAGLLLASVMLVTAGPSSALATLERVPTNHALHRDVWSLAWYNHLRSKALMQQGAYAEAETAAATAAQHADEGHDCTTAVFARLNLGAIASRTQRPSQARAAFAMALQLAEEAGFSRGVAYALTNLADLDLTQSHHAEALIRYERALQHIERPDAKDAYLRACAVAHYAYTLVIVGRATEAIALLVAEPATLATNSQLLNHLEIAISLGFAYHRAGQLDQADAVLRAVTQQADSISATTKLARARLHLAAVGLARGESKNALSSLTAALQAAASTDGVATISVEARHLPELHPLLVEIAHPLVADLQVALRQPLADVVESELVPLEHDTLVSRRQSASSDSHGNTKLPADTESPSLVRVYTLGKPRVAVGAKIITKWRTPQAQELLLYLLERGSASRDQILSALWPDDDPYSQSTSTKFRLARFRLKEALGISVCLRQEGPRTEDRWSLAVPTWYDAREFEQLADQAVFSNLKEHSEVAISLFREALTHWSGPYLDGMNCAWSEDRRLELQRRYHEVLEQVAELELSHEEVDRAIDHYCRLLQEDPYREAAHRGLMRCYVLRGETARALEQYRRCYDILGRDLGAEPSPETTALYYTLRPHRVKLAPEERQHSPADLETVRHR